MGSQHPTLSKDLPEQVVFAAFLEYPQIWTNSQPVGAESSSRALALLPGTSCQHCPVCFAPQECHGWLQMWQHGKAWQQELRLVLSCRHSQLHQNIPKPWFPLYSAGNKLLHSESVSKHYAMCPQGIFKVNAWEAEGDVEEKSLHPEQVDHSPKAAPRGVNSSSSCGCAPSVKGTRHCCPMSSDSFPSPPSFY